MKPLNKKKHKEFKVGQSELIYFFNSAYKDYIAARTLLLENLLSQGAGLACTAIEKYLKCLILFKGDNNIAQTHDIKSKKLLNPIKQFDKDLYHSFNQQFLTLLSKAYNYRYPSSLQVNYNIVLCKYKILSELDRMVYNIENSFEPFEVKKRKYERDYIRDIRNNNSLLLNKNGLLNPSVIVKELIETKETVFECRVFGKLNIDEITYETSNAKDDNQFIYEALIVDAKNPDTLHLAFKNVLQDSVNYKRQGFHQNQGN